MTSFAIGDKVFGQGNPVYPTPDLAGLQEYAILDAEAVARLPEGVAMDDAVIFPVNATTSFEALFHPENGFGFPALLAGEGSVAKKESIDPKAQTVVIIGGGPSVGRLAIQYASLVGIGRIMTVASVRNEAHLRSLGATHVVDRHDTQESIAKKIHKIVPRDDITHIYDRVSWEFSLPLSMVSKTKKSKVLTLHPAESGACCPSPGARTRTVRSSIVTGHNDFLRPLLKLFWAIFPQWVKEGKIVVPKHRVIEGLDLEKIESALDDYRDRSPVLQVVVHPWARS